MEKIYKENKYIKKIEIIKEKIDIKKINDNLIIYKENENTKE